MTTTKMALFHMPCSLSILAFSVALLCLLLSSEHGQALPLLDSHNRALYFSGAGLRDPSSPLAIPVGGLRFLGDPEDLLVGQKKRRDLGTMQTLLAKKYDRNCFFSPVQCMLSFKDGSNGMGGGSTDVLFGGDAGRR